MKKKSLFLIILLAITVGLVTPVKAETYDGEYSIDYLLKNYSVVTLGQKDPYDKLSNYLGNPFRKGDFYYTRYDNDGTVNGAVLVSGNIYRENNSDKSFSLTVNSNTKSYIKGTIGDKVQVSSRVTDSNYLDFSKMYEEVMKESQAIADNTKYYINNKKMEITTPGIYTIQNTAVLKDIGNNVSRNNTLLIKNYDRNSLYVFNYYNEFIYTNMMPNIMIMENNSSNAAFLSDYINSGNYTGNIIFNFPNAKKIDIQYDVQYLGLYDRCYYNDLQKCEGINAHIIAPNADVYIESGFYGKIISNGLTLATDIQNVNYTLNKKIVEKENYIFNTKDFNDDIYSRDYSIKDLLENYSLVTLGHKAISLNAKLSGLTNRNGSVRLFHVTGQALINGDMVYDKGGFISAFDLQSNKATVSYINGKGFIELPNTYNGFTPNGGYTVIQPWDNMDNDNTEYLYQKNTLFVEGNSDSIMYIVNNQGNFTSYIHNYINFDRLYDNVVSEQKEISCGADLKVGEDGVVHIPIGGNYTIEDISNVKEVVFDNFEKNKDELTIITIKNGGDINFPLISKSGSGYKGIVTNDYYGKEEATHLYEMNTFLSEDSYHGNIVWNVPNATYIKLKENAPFAGHLIAPNADVDTPETHFAGCFIVNSIYGEGNTEAHFYPLTVDLDCDCDEYNNLDSNMKRRFSEYKLRKLLGGDGTIVETNVIGDEVQYRKDMETFEHIYKKCPVNSSNNPITNIITNPDTYKDIGIVLVIVFISAFCIIFDRRSLKDN